MKNILILGGGYGGLKCAITLQKKLEAKDVKVTLVSKHDYHYQTTLLHKVAAGTYSARKARVFFRKILTKVNFIKDTITQIDIKTKQVHGSKGCYSYDFLVIALGFEANSFGIKGVDEFAYKLSDIGEALKLRQNIESKFKDFSFNSDINDLKFVVVGSGFTGVEFASEFAIRAKELCHISAVDESLVKTYLIGRSERILPMFDEKLSTMAKEKLTNLGIKIIQGDVIECQKDGVLIEQNGEISQIKANTILWSAGVRGNSAIKNSNLETKDSRVVVNEFLQMPENPEVFVIGDCAIATQRDIIHAPTAQLASQMGEYCAYNLMLLTENKTLEKGFKFKHRGTVCSIGHTDAVGVAYKMSFTGEIAALLKNFIENRWLFGIAGLFMVLKKGQFRFRSSD